MKLRAYRNLYWANQGLLHAVRALEELRREPELSSTRLREIQKIIEQTRVSMNDALAGPYGQGVDPRHGSGSKNSSFR